MLEPWLVSFPCGNLFYTGTDQSYDADYETNDDEEEEISTPRSSSRMSTSANGGGIKKKSSSGGKEYRSFGFGCSHYTPYSVVTTFRT